MSELDEIRARVRDCATYNFGMRNADKLAHEDAPRLLAALHAIQEHAVIAEALCEMNGTEKRLASVPVVMIHNAITAALTHNDKDRRAA
jgi:hypothetical protein